MDVNGIIDRAKSILLTPENAWQTIQGESGDARVLFREFLLYLAAIPAIAIFIGQSIVGYSAPFENKLTQIPIGVGLVAMILRYLLYLAGVYLSGLAISFLAPKFNGQKNTLAALRLVSYSATPGWLASALYVIPRLGDLSVFGYLYGIYLFYVGLPMMLDCPEEKALSYTAASLAILFIVMIGIVVIISAYIT